MDYFAGLDVSVKETSVCIVDDTGCHACNRTSNRAADVDATRHHVASTRKAGAG